MAMKYILVLFLLVSQQSFASWDCTVSEVVESSASKIAPLRKTAHLFKGQTFTVDTNGTISGNFDTTGYEHKTWLVDDGFKMQAAKLEDGYPVLRLLEIDSDLDGSYFSMYFGGLNLLASGTCTTR